jgi:hypothetical protein
MIVRCRIFYHFYILPPPAKLHVCVMAMGKIDFHLITHVSHWRRGGEYAGGPYVIDFR